MGFVYSEFGTILSTLFFLHVQAPILIGGCQLFAPDLNVDWWYWFLIPSYGWDFVIFSFLFTEKILIHLVVVNEIKYIFYALSVFACVDLNSLVLKINYWLLPTKHFLFSCCFCIANKYSYTLFSCFKFYNETQARLVLFNFSWNVFFLIIIFILNCNNITLERFLTLGNHGTLPML